MIISIVNAAVRQFGLPNAIVVATLSCSARRSVYAATLEDGRRMVVGSVDPSHIRPSNLEDRACVMEFCRSHGLPVPLVSRAPAGDAYVRVGATLYTCEEFVDGDYYPGDESKLSARQSCEAALLLGDCHTVLRAGNSRWVPHTSPRFRPDDFIHVPAVEDLWLSALATIGAKKEKDAIDVMVDAVGRRKLVEIQGAKASLREMNRLVALAPRQLCHGDYRAQNLVFRGGRVAGIIDWEHSRSLTRIWEVTRAAASFAKRGRTELFNTPIDVQAFVGFCADYSSRVRLTSAEVNLIVPIAFAASLFPFYLIAMRYRIPPGTPPGFQIPKDDRLDKMYPSDSLGWSWWGENKEAVNVALREKFGSLVG